MRAGASSHRPPLSLAKIMDEYIGDREEGFLFETENHGLPGLHRLGPAEKHFVFAGLVFGAS